MLWLIASALCAWIAWREASPFAARVRGRRVAWGFVALLLAAATALAVPPARRWHLERVLARTATQLAEGRRATVHCNSMLDTMLDSNVFAAGHADPHSGRVVIQHPYCDRLRDYLKQPSAAGRAELFSVHLLTHESMHVRGELNEAATNCQAVQRYHRAARLMGASEKLARDQALHFYRELYLANVGRDGAFAYYYDAECGPGKKLDERLPDAVWNERSAEAPRPD